MDICWINSCLPGRPWLAGLWTWLLGDHRSSVIVLDVLTHQFDKFSFRYLHTLPDDCVLAWHEAPRIEWSMITKTWFQCSRHTPNCSLGKVSCHRILPTERYAVVVDNQRRIDSYIAVVILTFKLQIFAHMCLQQIVRQIIRDVRRYGTLMYDNCILTWLQDHWVERSCMISAGLFLCYEQ